MLWLSDLWDWISRMAAKFWHAVYPSAGSPRTYRELIETSTPCRNDAFAFDVTVHALWTLRGNFDMFDLDARKETQLAAVKRRLRAVSRRYPPEAAAPFEHVMNGELASTKFADDPKLTCVCSVQVAPDKKLVEQLRAAAIARLDHEAKHDQKARDMDHLEVMQARWLAFLRQLEDDPLGQLAARLAGDDNLADAIKQHASDKQRISDELRGLFDTATTAYRDKDVFDFAMTTDSALSRLLRHIRADGTPSRNGSKPAAGLCVVEPLAAQDSCDGRRSWASHRCGQPRQPLTVQSGAIRPGLRPNGYMLKSNAKAKGMDRRGAQTPCCNA